MIPRVVQLPEGRVWLRVASPTWDDPLDPSYAGKFGGRWNPPGSHPTLYLNADVATARMQVDRVLAGSPVAFDDLDDEAYVLVAASLPRAQSCGQAVTNDGLRALGLPASYPLDPCGEEVGHDVCRAIGQQVHDAGLRGLWCRSACTGDGRGRELAWFPATARSTARMLWEEGLPLGAWRHVTRWAELGFDDQPDPAASRIASQP
ncbi:hypothetical protein BH24GEM3_BH24GEM3_25570 [soil metagenome]